MTCAGRILIFHENSGGNVEGKSVKKKKKKSLCETLLKDSHQQHKLLGGEWVELLGGEWVEKAISDSQQEGKDWFSKLQSFSLKKDTGSCIRGSALYEQGKSGRLGRDGNRFGWVGCRASGRARVSNLIPVPVYNSIALVSMTATRVCFTASTFRWVVWRSLDLFTPALPFRQFLFSLNLLTYLLAGFAMVSLFC